MRASGSVYGPEVSYTVIGGLSSPPNRVGVAVCAISRIATRRSGREPAAKTLREPGIGRVTESESCWACCCRREGMAFIGIVLCGRDEAAAHAAHGSRADKRGGDT